MSLSQELLRHWVDVPCPVCGYQFDVQLLDVRVQAYKRCPCCRVRIHLIDEGGSTFGALETINNAMSHFEQALGRLGR